MFFCFIFGINFFIIVKSENYVLSGDIPLQLYKEPENGPAENEVLDVSATKIGKKPLNPLEFPYEVGLGIDCSESAMQRWCSGSLIAHNWVLTAAHCVYVFYYCISAVENRNSNEVVSALIVHLGFSSKLEQNETNRQIQVMKQNIVQHPLYSSRTMLHDIALLKLPISVELNEYVQLIRLPKINERIRYFDDYSLLSPSTKAGLNTLLEQTNLSRKHHKQINLVGRTIISPSAWSQYMKHSNSSSLKYIEFKVISYDQCKSFVRGNLTDDMHVCINSPGKTGCDVDSGGPTVITENDGLKTLIGVNSFVSKKRCKVGHPTVLTRVQKYLKWIQIIASVPLRN